jgi:hypothetical protein
MDEIKLWEALRLIKVGDNKPILIDVNLLYDKFKESGVLLKVWKIG